MFWLRWLCAPVDRILIKQWLSFNCCWLSAFSKCDEVPFQVELLVIYTVWPKKKFLHGRKLSDNRRTQGYI